MKTIGLGALVWLAVYFAPLDPNVGMGTIEKLFLLGPLVVVPLGLNLVGALGQRALPAALLVVMSFLVPQGKLAGVLVLPWLVLAIWWAVGGLRRWRWEPAEVCRNMAVLMLPVGAGGGGAIAGGDGAVGVSGAVGVVGGSAFSFRGVCVAVDGERGDGKDEG